MLNLLKYELLRKSRILIISVIILLLVECGILFGIYKGGGWSALAILLIFLMTSGTILFVFIDSVRSYSTDLNQKEGYSLFLTPTSGYKIIGSKAIISFVELIVMVAIVFGFMVINLKFTQSLYTEAFEAVITPLFEALEKLYTIPSLFELFLVVMVYVFEWFAVIMIAILSMTLRKTILSSSKLGWLISLIFFVVIYSAMETITMVVLAPFGFVNEIFDMSRLGMQANSSTVPPNFTFDIFKYIGISACLYPIYLSVLFFFSGKLLNKRVDL